MIQVSGKDDPRDSITQFALDMAAERIAAMTIPASTGLRTPMAVIVKILSSTPGNSGRAATPITEHRKSYDDDESSAPETASRCRLGILGRLDPGIASYDTEIDSRKGSTR